MAQHLPDQPKPEGSVCVAQLVNLSTEFAQEPQLATRLIANFKRLKISVVAMESRTPSRQRLAPDADTGTEARDKNCDYILLTQIVTLHRGLGLNTSPESIGARRIPSTDASENGRDRALNDVQLRFTLFRLGRLDPIVDDAISSLNSTSTNYNLEEDVDREASRVRRELGKK